MDARPVVVETWEGDRCAGHGTCRICGWSGFGLYDFAVDGNECDEQGEGDCPKCDGVGTVDARLIGAEDWPAGHGRAGPAGSA